MNLFLMFLTTFLIQLIITTEMNLIAPLAPFISQYFNISPSSVIMFNIGFSLIGLLVPILGAFSDKYGKKKSLMIALAFHILGTFISGFAKKPIIFALGRILIGIGYFSLSGTNLSYLSEFIPYESRGKASGLLRAAFGIAIVFSPLYATSMISRYKVLSSAYLPLTIMGFICLLLLVKLPETETKDDLDFNVEELFMVLKDPISYKTLMVVFLILATPSLLLSFLGVHLSNGFNLNQVQIGYTYTIIASGTIIGIIFAALFTDKIGKEKLSRFLFTLVLATLIPMALVKSLPPTVILLTIMTFGIDGGWTAYQTLCSEINPKKRGTYMSLFYTVNAITMTVYSILGPVFYNLGGYRLLIFIAIINVTIALKLLYSTPIEETIINNRTPS